MSEKALLVAADDADNIQGYLGATPPVSRLPKRGERFWVDRPQQLLNAVSVLKQAKVVAVDAEFTQVRTRAQTSGEPVSMVPRLSLLQLAIDRTCFVVDTLRLQDLVPLTSVVSNPQITLLLHGAGGDMRVMAERGLQVVHYYDLEATCRSIFGQHESSLAAMLQRAFAFHLDKSLQRTDWTRRPLPPAMIAYAARDAEVTLALYRWLDLHYHSILQSHEVNEQTEEVVAPWIEPFLKGSSPLSPEVAVVEARKCGLLQSRSQVATDCLTALSQVIHPMRRSRLLRLIADLGLTQLVPDILPLLQAPTADERAGSTRALGRLLQYSATERGNGAKTLPSLVPPDMTNANGMLEGSHMPHTTGFTPGVRSVIEAITPLLRDPVQDVRKAAQTAIRNLSHKGAPEQHAVPVKNGDGSRRWVVMEREQDSPVPCDDDHWQSRLRSIMDA